MAEDREHHPEKGVLGMQGLQGQTLIWSGDMAAGQSQDPGTEARGARNLGLCSQLPVIRYNLVQGHVGT